MTVDLGEARRPVATVPRFREELDKLLAWVNDSRFDGDTSFATERLHELVSLVGNVFAAVAWDTDASPAEILAELGDLLNRVDQLIYEADRRTILTAAGHAHYQIEELSFQEVRTIVETAAKAAAA